MNCSFFMFYQCYQNQKNSYNLEIGVCQNIRVKFYYYTVFGNEYCEFYLMSLISGNYFGSHFIMGGERFDTPQPESYLFGENSDLNFLGSRPTPVSPIKLVFLT